MSSSKETQGPARQPKQSAPSSSTSKASNKPPSSEFAYPIVHDKERTAFLSGLVESEGGPGSFVDGAQDERLQDLKRLYGQQPSLFVARQDWSGWDPKDPIRLSTADTRFDDVEKKLENISYPGLQSPLARRKWAGRAFELWRCARKMLTREMLVDGDLCALMQMISDGMEDIVVTSRAPITIHSKVVCRNKEFPDEKMSPFLADNYEKADCNIELGYSDNPQALRRSWEGKRFVVILVLHKDIQHYTSLVWDRVTGKLYHFDTILSNRKPRMKRAVLAMRELLSSLGLPHNFWYYSMPLCQQISGWECGPLVVYCALQLIRGLVGLTATEAKDFFGGTVQGLRIDRKPDQSGVVPPFDLPLRDWVPKLDAGTKDMAAKVRLARDSLIAWWIAVIFDHIGIQDLTYHEPDKNGKPREKKIPNYHLISYFPKQDGKMRPIGELYTNLGGEAVIFTKDCEKRPMQTDHRLLVPPQNVVLATPRPRAMQFPAYRYLFPAVSPSVKTAWLERGVRFDEAEVPLRYIAKAKTQSSMSLLSSPEIDPQALLDSTKVDLTFSSEQLDAEGKGDGNGKGKGKGKGKARADNDIRDRAATPKRDPTPPVQGFDQLLLNTPRGPQAARPSRSDATPRASQQQQQQQQQPPQPPTGSRSNTQYGMDSSFVKGFVGINQLPGYGASRPANPGPASTYPQHTAELPHPQPVRKPILLGPGPSSQPPKRSTPPSSQAINSPKPTKSGSPSGSEDVVMKDRSDSEQSPLSRPTPIPRKSRAVESPLGSDTSMPDVPSSAGPSDQTQRRLFNSRPLGLPASTSNRSLAGPDAEYQPSTAGSSPSGGGELSDRLSRSSSMQLDSPRRPPRGPVEDVPNPIVGARVKTPAQAGFKGLEERMANAPAGSRAMSVILGTDFDLPNYPARTTTELVFHRGTGAETRNYATHVPSGFHRLVDFGLAQDDILKYLNGEDKPEESRAQRRERWAREKEARERRG